MTTLFRGTKHGPDTKAGKMRMGGESFLYFGYGSNMLTERLRARCPSARPIGPFCAPGFEMRFNVLSEDGSSKAGLFRNAEHTAWGVLYEIDLAERHILDRFEHVPVVYERKDIEVCEQPGETLSLATTYLPRPEHLTKELVPYDWYKALCEGGARQHGLPAEAIAEMAAIPVARAPYAHDFSHNGLKVALQALTAAGFAEPDGTLLI